MSIKLTGLTAVLTAMAATAIPSSVKPLSVGLNRPCSVDLDCTSNYCYQTTKQIARKSPGVCTTQVADGGSCYKDAGCLDGSCVNSVCQPQAPTQPGSGVTFQKAASGLIGTISDLAYKQAARPKPAQPYLTFNEHYVSTADVINPPVASGPNSIKRNAEIMTTSGTGHKLAVNAYKLVFPPDSETEQDFYQLRVPSRSNQCISATRLDQDQGTLLYRLAPCVTPTESFNPTDVVPPWALQLWYINSAIDLTGSQSLPFMNGGDSFSSSEGVAYPAGSYSTWGARINPSSAKTASLWLGPAYKAAAA